MAVSNAVGLTLGAGAAAAVFVAIVMIVPRQQPAAEDPQEAVAASIGEISSEGAEVTAAPQVADEQSETADAVSEPEASEPETADIVAVPEDRLPGDLEAILPAFDNVRIVTDGADFSVISGMAAAGAQVAIMLDDEVVATATADASGAFAEVLMIAPSPQPRMLSLVSDPEGSATRSDDMVLIAPTAPLVVAALEPETEGPGTAADVATEAVAMAASEPAEEAVDIPTNEPVMVETATAPEEGGVEGATLGPVTAETESATLEPIAVEVEAVEADPSEASSEPESGPTAVPNPAETDAQTPDAVASETIADPLDTNPEAPDLADLAVLSDPVDLSALSEQAEVAPEAVAETEMAIAPGATSNDALETAANDTANGESPAVTAHDRQPAVEADATRETTGNLPSRIAEDQPEVSVVAAADGPVTAPTAQSEPLSNPGAVTDAATIMDATTQGLEPEGVVVAPDAPVVVMTETPQTPAEMVAVAEPAVLPEPGNALVTAQDAPGTLQSEARPESVAEVQPQAPAPDVTDESGVLPTPDLAAAEAPARAPVLVADAAGVRVLQPAIAPGATADVLETVALDSIAYDDAGDVTLSGRAVGGGFVRVYVDNRPVIEATVGTDGIWESGLPDVATGVYTMRVDQIDASGAVVSRIETPFLREEREAIAAVMAEETAQEGFNLAVRTVQPGNTLWAIARDRYGDGILYVEVFAANRDRIRNPDLIYPGQIFVLPELAAQ